MVTILKIENIDVPKYRDPQWLVTLEQNDGTITQERWTELKLKTHEMDVRLRTLGANDEDIEKWNNILTLTWIAGQDSAAEF